MTSVDKLADKPRYRLYVSLEENILLEEDVDYWCKELAPSKALQEAFNQLGTSPSHTKLLIDLYQEELSLPNKDFLINVIRSDIKQGKKFTFVCKCDASHFCHHKALNEIIRMENPNV